MVWQYIIDVLCCKVIRLLDLTICKNEKEEQEQSKKSHILDSYSLLLLYIRVSICLSSVVTSFKMGIFPFSIRDDRWHLPRFGRMYSLAEKVWFRQLIFCNFPKRISKDFFPWYNNPCLILTEVLEMDNKKTCADCINLGREVYCMKWKKKKNGYKDLFVDAAPVQAKQPVVSKN